MEFDRTRKAIGSEKLDEKARLEALNKLKEAGGQVLRESSKKQPPAHGQRPRQDGEIPRRAGDDIALPSQLAREKQREENERLQAMRRAAEEERRAAVSFMARFGIKFRCRMAGITPFGLDMVKPMFFSKINLDAKRALMECNILGNELLLSNPELGQEIITELDKRNPIYVELIDRGTKLYDRIELAELTAEYNDDSRRMVRLESVRAPVFSLLRKLYYLKSFQETYRTAVDQAIDIQQRVEKKQPALYASKKKKIFSDWDTLMEKIFPLLVMLAQRAEMKRAEPGTRLFEEILGVVNDDRPGRRRPGEPVRGQPVVVKKPTAEEKPGDAAASTSEPGTEADKAAEEKPNVDSREAEYTHGMRLLSSYGVPALRQKYGGRDWAAVADADKVMISILYLMEFEEEYSFVLTTPKIKINAAYVNGVKVDYRQKLADIVQGSRSCYDGFRKYAQECEEYQKVAKESVSGNYVEHAKRLSLQDTRRGASGRTVRVGVKTYMNGVVETLNVVIEDIRASGQIVSNPDEPVKFDVALEAKKRMQGRTVRECITEAYCYALALLRRLEQGDLFGGVLEVTQDEYDRSFARPEQDPGVFQN